VEYVGHVSSPSGREKIEYSSRIEEIYEENKIQKMHYNQNVSQTNKKTSKSIRKVGKLILITYGNTG
jgi:hypothetical protein